MAHHLAVALRDMRELRSLLSTCSDCEDRDDYSAIEDVRDSLPRAVEILNARHGLPADTPLRDVTLKVSRLYAKALIEVRQSLRDADAPALLVQTARAALELDELADAHFKARHDNSDTLLTDALATRPAARLAFERLRLREDTAWDLVNRLTDEVLK